MIHLLISLRYLAVALQWLALLWVSQRLGMQLPWSPLILSSALLLAFNVFSHCWFRRRREVASNQALWLQLSVDVLALTVLFYFTGGPTNPFVSLYLVPIAMAATALELLPVAGLTLMTALSYTWLMKHNVAMPHVHGGDFQLHVSGMWINFLLSSAIMVAVLGRFMGMLKDQRRRLAEVRERTLRDESLLALGTLAAGTAHELNTPLTTIGLMLDEWQNAATTPDAEAIACLRVQVLRCQEHVRALAALARHGAVGGASMRGADDFVFECIDRLLLLRPGADVEISGSAGTAKLMVEPALPQALINLMNNAVDASLALVNAATIEIKLEAQSGRLIIRILDRGVGPGAGLGVVAATRDSPGLGIGLMISNASIERSAGCVRHYARAGGGCVAEVDLPLEDSR